MWYYHRMFVTKAIIYGLKDPRDGLVYYVGQSTRGMRRATKHFNPSSLSRDNSPKSLWLRGLIQEGVEPDTTTLEILEDPGLLLEREKFWIETWQKLNPKLTNVPTTQLGSHFKGRVISEQQRQRLRKQALRRWKDPRERERASLKQRGRVFTEEHKQKVSEGQKRRFQNEVERRVAAERLASVRPVRLSDESRMKLARDRGAKPFLDQFGNLYESVREAGRVLGLDSSTISKVLKGKLGQTHGYVFKYR